MQTTHKKKYLQFVIQKEKQNKNHSTDKMHNPEKRKSLQSLLGRLIVSGSWNYKHVLKAFKKVEEGKIYNNNKRWLNEDEPTLCTSVWRYRASVTVVLPALLRWNVVAPFSFSLVISREFYDH